MLISYIIKLYFDRGIIMDNLSKISTIKQLFEKYGFSFSKTLGQNFLINPTVCPRIAEQGNAQKGFGVIEIGTGIGVLTNELAKRAEKVVAIELDERLKPILSETLAEYDNVKIIFADVMETDLHKIIAEEFKGLHIVVCANLPYYITSPVIMKLLEERLPIESITVMVQKEAGVRLCAKLGTRDVGAVTVAVRYFAEPEILFDVSRGSFMPAPNVDSCVIRLNVHNDAIPEGFDEKFFFRMVRGAFSQRRKTFANSVSSALGCEKSKVFEALDMLKINQSVRPEQLTMEQFKEISQKLSKVL